MASREKLIHHIESLREKCDNLDLQIKELEESNADSLKIETLKTLKLKAKDNMEVFQKKLNGLQ